MKGWRMTIEKVFKICPMCSTVWVTRDDFLHDTSLYLNGYGVDSEELNCSLFYFTHMVPGCRSTLVIEARDFKDLYLGLGFSERRNGLEGCPGYCFLEEGVDNCDARCECACNRVVIQIIKKRQEGCKE